MIESFNQSALDFILFLRSCIVLLLEFIKTVQSL